MDLSKAFDCLPHDILLSKLSAYGLSESASSLLKSYLSDRKQQIKIESVEVKMASSQLRATQVIFGICNVIFLVTGAAMMIIGAYLQISRSNFIDLMIDDDFFTATALLISSGTIVVVLCLFGFIGLWMRSQCILLIYFLCVIVIMALSLAAGIIAYVFHREIEDELQQKMLSGLKDKDKRDEWDLIQSKERCCGVTNYTDWYGLADPDYPDSIPDSCCDGPNCGLQGATVAYSVGCYEKGKDWVQDNFYMLGAAGVVLGVIQIILLASSLALVIMLRREKVLV
ncbi:hypothetical protein ACF0H5_015895 [Mactra antiquata]